jgi:hypothetical protein
MATRKNSDYLTEDLIVESNEEAHCDYSEVKLKFCMSFRTNYVLQNSRFTVSSMHFSMVVFQYEL